MSTVEISGRSREADREVARRTRFGRARGIDGVDRTRRDGPGADLVFDCPGREIAADRIPDRVVQSRARDHRLAPNARLREDDPFRVDDLYQDDTRFLEDDRDHCRANDNDRCPPDDDPDDRCRDLATNGRIRQRNTSHAVAREIARDLVANHRRECRPSRARKSTAKEKCTVDPDRRVDRFREIEIAIGIGIS